MDWCIMGLDLNAITVDKFLSAIGGILIEWEGILTSKLVAKTNRSIVVVFE